MKLPTPDRDHIVSWVTDAYDKISEESIRRTFQSIGYNCAEFEVNNEMTNNNSNDIDNSNIIIEDFEEEGTINIHDLNLHIPTY
jgi:hypothetical protein